MNKTRALIVDDEVEISLLVCDHLTRNDIDADAVSDGAAMRRAVAATRYDVVVLEVVLPDADGLALCRELRAVQAIPVIFLTARSETADVVIGLETGADDYLVKPLKPRELVARIQTVLRRSRSVVDTTVMPAKTIVFAGWTLHRVTRHLTRPETLPIPLSNAEFRLLSAFIERPQQVLSRDYLIDVARGRSADVFDRSIDLLVSRLRQKLCDDPKAPQLLKTLRGEGYLLDAEPR